MSLKTTPNNPSANRLLPVRWGLWKMGFRPFFLLAGTFAVVSMLGWVAQMAGWMGTHVYLPGPPWHAHEMIFGYAFAVITGFLFTAVRNWTGEATPSGSRLAAIAGLWAVGRFSVMLSWPAMAAVADTIFALTVAAGIGTPLYKSGNRRNYFFIALILVFGGLNLCFYLVMAGWALFPPERGLLAGLDLVLLVMVIMGGRVIPMFTANTVPGSTPRRRNWLEWSALASIPVLLLADLLGFPAPLIVWVTTLAAIIHGIRLALWQPLRTLKAPILWILHASYAWIIVHLVLRSLAAAQLVPTSPALHALTVGALGGLTLGMMTRVSRGHTGLPLKAGALEIASYALIECAALMRVFGPLVVPQSYLAAIVAAGLLWATAFALFVIRFYPILTRA